MKLKLKITPQQAFKILNSIPKGSSIKLSVRDANQIIDSSKSK